VSLAHAATGADRLSAAEVARLVARAVEDSGGLAGIVKPGDAVLLEVDIPQFLRGSDVALAGFVPRPEASGIATDYRIVAAIADLFAARGAGCYLFTGEWPPPQRVLGHLRYTQIDLPRVRGIVYGNTAELRLRRGFSGASGDDVPLSRVVASVPLAVALPCIKVSDKDGLFGALGSVMLSLEGGDDGGPDAPVKTGRRSVFAVADCLQGLVHWEDRATSPERFMVNRCRMGLIAASARPDALDAVMAAVFGIDLARFGHDSVELPSLDIRGMSVHEARAMLAVANSEYAALALELERLSAPLVTDCSRTDGRLALSLALDPGILRLDFRGSGRVTGSYLTESRRSVRLEAILPDEGPVVLTGFDRMLGEYPVTIPCLPKE
jgi:uncharacterized protein (DUF362 family)